jgi:error-prone DNA polymerase
MGFYGPHVLVNDGKRHGVNVLPPDINLSGANCAVEGGAVRIGLRYVKGLGEAVAQEVAGERQQNRPFRSLFDFLERTRLKREPIENLIACGAFDDLGLERRELLWQIGLLYRSDGRNGRERQLALPLPTEQDMVELAPMSEWDRMVADYAILGLSPNYHSMAFLRPRLNEGIVPSRMLESLPDGTPVEVAGLVVCRQRPGTAKGFVFVVIEDEFGLVNLVVKPGLHEQQRSLVRSEPFVIVRGQLQRRDGTVNVIAERFTALPSTGSLAPTAHNFG